jgi:hypothetical protein
MVILCAWLPRSESQPFLFVIAHIHNGVLLYMNSLKSCSNLSPFFPSLPSYYTYLPLVQGIQAPVNADKDRLVQLILGHQARVLTERAQKAVQQIGHAHQPEDVLSVNPQALEPPTTAYSSSSSSPSSRLNQSSTGSGGQSSSMDIRSRVRAHIHLRMVCTPLNLFLSLSY